MAEPIVLPPGVAIGILAFLLALLPAGLFLWLWYLRRHDRPVPARVVIGGLVLGMLLVAPAYYLELWAPQLWERVSPGTVHYLDGAILPIQTISDVLLPAIGTFLIVALVEEGLRYLALVVWFRKSKNIDQVFDGLLVGLAAGLGFATVENAIYFFSLFSTGQFNTLVFVFFLRFIISTLAHISFGGIMGVLLARGFFSVYRSGWLYAQAFFLPWFLHGLYDWLLGVNQTLYAVLLLLLPLWMLVAWMSKREFFAIQRSDSGQLLPSQQAPKDVLKKTAHQRKTDNPWNRNAPWVGARSV